MKTRFVFCVALLAGLMGALGQTPSAAEESSAAAPVPPPSSPPLRGTNELLKLVEPIALHPDPLIAIILPASVYPLEIVQAARFVKDTNNIPKVDDQPWDDNVKEVARFPELIAMMDADISWTMELGDAFVEQPDELMAAIQTLRSKAKNAGTLQTSPQQIVSVTNIVVLQTNVHEVTTVTKQIVQIQPANPQIIYVPVYPPTVYYPPPYYVYNPYAPLIAFGVLGLSLVTRAADTGETFATPEAAVAALQKATSTHDSDALRQLFGPVAEDLENPDCIQATNEFNEFTAALNLTNRFIHKSDTKYVLEIGTNAWPFPVPIVKKNDRWFFDTEAGKEELLNRRLGRNELDTLAVMRAYVDAQREYARKDRDGTHVLKYAQKLASSPGKTDGLYWPPDLTGEISPLGPLVAAAREEGYFPNEGAGTSSPQDSGRQPFHGYYFKILTRQGKHAPGGKFNYIINGNMMGGFALVAWPAEYGETGVMTFIVNQQGRVFEQDLGKNTAQIHRKMSAYDPDAKWHLSPD